MVHGDTSEWRTVTHTFRREMCLIANDEQQRHAIEYNGEQSDLFVSGTMIDNFAKRTIGGNNRGEEYDQTVYAVHIRIRFAQLLHHVAQIDPQVSVFG